MSQTARLITFGATIIQKDDEPGLMMSESEIDTNLKGPFPASDPPLWTLLHRSS